MTTISIQDPGHHAGYILLDKLPCTHNVYWSRRVGIHSGGELESPFGSCIIVLVSEGGSGFLIIPSPPDDGSTPQPFFVNWASSWEALDPQPVESLCINLTLTK